MTKHSSIDFGENTRQTAIALILVKAQDKTLQH